MGIPILSYPVFPGNARPYRAVCLNKLRGGSNEIVRSFRGVEVTCHTANFICRKSELLTYTGSNVHIKVISKPNL